MKKLLVCALIIVAGFGLAAKQVSFLGIWFGQTVTEAESLLDKQGFSKTLEPLAYESLGSSDIKQVELTLDKNNLVNGWIIYFAENLPSDRYYAILQEAISMHGKEYRTSVAENALAWNLESNRDFRLGFNDDLALQFGVYHDNSAKN